MIQISTSTFTNKDGETMKINMTSKDGVTLLTQGKYCTENIEVTPTFETGGGTNGEAIAVATESEMNAILASATASDYGKIYQYTGETTATYTQNALYILQE